MGVIALTLRNPVARASVLALAASVLASCGGGRDPVESTASSLPLIAARPQSSEAPAVRALASVVAAEAPNSPYGGVSPSEAIEQLLNFGEAAYKSYFPGHAQTVSFGKYRYRYYPSSGTYLGVATAVATGDGLVEGGVYVAGGPFGPTPVFVGTLAQFITPFKTDASYSCHDTGDAMRCYTQQYQILAGLTSAQLINNLISSNANQRARNPALLSCKRSVACSISDLAQGTPPAQLAAMRAAASSVVRLTWPAQTFAGVQFNSFCTGTVVKNSLDQSIYVLTAGHCFYEAGQSYLPLVYSGSYRSNGVPIYATFHFEEPACGSAVDYAAVPGRTVPAAPVFSSFTQFVESNMWSGQPYNGAPDIALLQLMGPLPAGVTPIRVSFEPVTPQKKLFVYSHPLGLGKSGGLLQGVANATSYQYLVKASTRVVEGGSSGGPIFSYDPSTEEVSVVGLLSGSSNPDAVNPTCAATEDLIVTRADSHSIFLPRYLGAPQ